jgi:glycosyltransferase involved in cell wall biosynthesis
VKIGLYIEHGIGNGVGGAELMIAHLASAWSRNHQVDLVHHRPPLTRERLQLFTDDDLSQVTFRYVPREDETPAFANPLRRYTAARGWHQAVSEGYNLFVNCTHWLPCFCHADRGALLVLFPFYIRPEYTDAMKALPAWKRARHAAYHGLEWRRRLATYQHRFSISEFSREWTRRRWGLDTSVIYPPVDVTVTPHEKEPLILSVGRFSTLAHTKKQLEMVNAFRQLSPGLPGWRYVIVGGLNDRAENREYFEKVRRQAAGFPAVVEANVETARVKQLFARARIFWHATGLGEDPDAHPELAEHFGIATVEAMAAGCVPVVINRGGQSNIVSHGVNGFLWNTIDEMLQYSEQLCRDEALWRTLSDAARRDAAQFSRARFVNQMTQACIDAGRTGQTAV